MRPVPEQAVTFVAAWEGLRLKSYQDPAGVWTIGYGHTSPKVHIGQTITEAQAKQLLSADLLVAASRLAAVVKRDVIDALTPFQYSALLSFVFNLGANPKWTIWKRLNARQFDQVPAEMVRFVYVGKTKLQGLLNRRLAEVKLWSTAEPGSADEHPPSSFTRFQATPPASANPTPLAKQPAFVATVIGLVLGLPSGIDWLVQQLTPFAPQYPAIAQAVDLLGHVSPIAVGLAGLVLWLQQKQAHQ
jgi:lysozyme